jgi:non-ribosomal peptide synthetase component F
MTSLLNRDKVTHVPADEGGWFHLQSHYDPAERTAANAVHNFTERVTADLVEPTANRRPSLPQLPASLTEAAMWLLENQSLTYAELLQEMLMVVHLASRGELSIYTFLQCARAERAADLIVGMFCDEREWLRALGRAREALFELMKLERIVLLPGVWANMATDRRLVKRLP